VVAFGKEEASSFSFKPWILRSIESTEVSGHLLRKMPAVLAALFTKVNVFLLTVYQEKCGNTSGEFRKSTTYLWVAGIDSEHEGLRRIP
jgi:hypothetical protein